MSIDQIAGLVCLALIVVVFSAATASIVLSRRRKP